MTKRQSNLKGCEICDGEYPKSKHNFDECYSLDLGWDLKQMYIIHQKTGFNRSTIDKYYTKISTVDICISLLSDLIQKSDTIIEPSAGNGAFIQALQKISDNCLFYDLLPEHPLILKQDFMYLKTPTADKIHVIGNPPFGRQSSLAIQFIKKACSFSDSVSFILPRSFKKQSMKNRFESHFHLIKEIDMPKNSFLVNDDEFDVPCVFQVWVKKPFPRKKITKLTPINFKFVKKDDNPTISFRRVGVNAGNISYDIKNKSIQSHYFIELDKTKVSLLKKVEYETNNTVGPRSISKQELIVRFNAILS
jgi:hypothetical protein